jgi:predicted DNA-binding protein (MmcQ/YjbR family)
LREEYDAVLPGYHMNKKHWNTIIIEGTVPSQKLFEWIDDSYSLIISGLNKSERKIFDKL